MTMPELESPPPAPAAPAAAPDAAPVVAPAPNRPTQQRPLPPGRRLLVVDASNIVMSCAGHGTVPPEAAARRATAVVQAAIRYLNPSHLVIAGDAKGETIRKQIDREYKKSRTAGRTSPYAVAAEKEWRALGWPCVAAAGYEADDIMAILATEAEVDEVYLFTNDSDMLALVTESAPYGTPVKRPDGSTTQRTRRVEVLRRAGRRSEAPLTRLNAAAVRGIYALSEPSQLVALKAITGDRTDEIQGVPGLTQAEGAALLRTHGSIEAIIAAGSAPGAKGHARLVAKHADRARHAYELARPQLAAPLPDAVRRCTGVVELRRAYARSNRKFLREVSHERRDAWKRVPSPDPEIPETAIGGPAPRRDGEPGPMHPARVVASLPAPTEFAPLGEAPVRAADPAAVTAPARVVDASPHAAGASLRRRVRTFLSSLFG